MIVINLMGISVSFILISAIEQGRWTGLVRMPAARVERAVRQPVCTHPCDGL